MIRWALAVTVLLVGAGCADERDRGGAPSGGVHGDSFHGDVLPELGWDLTLCQGCHGDDYAGGTSGVSCRTCHDDGPTACDTCHDATTDAHPAHVATAGVACAECHVVPDRWDADGHIDDGRAEVVLGALAARDVVPPRRTAPPSYDPATGTCASVYCHGGTLGDAAATAPAPRWNQPGAAACGGCHGAPPADHAQDTCATCHPGAPHLDGVLDVGVAGAGCSGCHGDDTSPAPPRGLGGETSPHVLAVGVHRHHLTSATLRGPVPCETCHAVPSAVDSAGHIDSVLPAEVALDLGWDREAMTCTGYCHGDATPLWTAAGDGQATCGTCHGLPPNDAPHTPGMPIASCTTCHPSVDEIGAIVFTTPSTSEHLDGNVDLR